MPVSGRLQSQKRLRDLEDKLEEVKQKKGQLSSEISEVEVGREESEERSAVLTALHAKQAQRVQLAKELEQYKSCDPQTLKELREFSFQDVLR
jgi:predicted  nucleic acid-binding Zn-ribbon protein